MVNEVIQFPFAEALLVEALKPNFPDRRFVTKIPANRPAEFIRLSRVGGPRKNLVIDQPMVMFQAWAKTDEAAGLLVQRLHAYVYALEHTQHPKGWIGGVREVGGVQAYPDNISDTPVYQFTTQFDLRGVAVT